MELFLKQNSTVFTMYDHLTNLVTCRQTYIEMDRALTLYHLNIDYRYTTYKCYIGMDGALTLYH